MKTNPCPKCGSAERARGKIYQKGTLRDIRFKADKADDLSLKEQVVAVACAKCGYIEFFLADREPA